MKKILSALLGATIVLSSCGTMAGGAGSGLLQNAIANQQQIQQQPAQQVQQPVQQQSAGSGLIGGLLSGAIGNATGNGGGAINSGSLIGGVIGSLLGNIIPASIEGTWTYAEPTVQFESENFLAKAGGVIAGQTLVNKIAPYYEKVGIKAGVMKITFNSDKTYSMTLGQRTINGTYVFDQSANTLTLNSQLGFKLISGFATLSANQLALTFDTSKLLTLVSTVAGGTSSLSTVSSIVGNYNGMKTGFLFNK